MSVDFLIQRAKEIQVVIDDNAPEIEKLDQEIGDGDHIFNVQRGIRLVIELEPTIKDLPMSKALNQIAMKVLSGIGGSSGALFATLLMGMSKKYNSDLNALHNLSEMFFEGVQSMKKRGKADVGEKTMLDVLIPVSNSLIELQNETDFEKVANNINNVAKDGMLSTKDIIATKGRASFLGERAKGHIDPGARSSQLAIEAICNQFINK